MPTTTSKTGSEISSNSEKFTCSRTPCSTFPIVNESPLKHASGKMFLGMRTSRSDTALAVCGPTIIGSSAGRAGGRKLRGHRKGPRALSPRPEPADRRDRQRKIHRGRRPGPAAGRPRLPRNGAHRRRRAPASRGSSRSPNRPRWRSCSKTPGSKSRIARFSSSAKSRPAASRGLSSAIARPPPLCSRIWRSTSPISTASTTSSSSFHPPSSATCWTPSPARATLPAK